ncbi:Ankyrin repeat and SOCS box protein 7 [Orbilia blumenaviensis]|uniref:Ankyrin repeat and SOCS box protein 7 n=1 Tax=Orbilia blumenaviensis TaxID=1796055 RepID=A0AAV9V5G9_9PEZI
MAQHLQDNFENPSWTPLTAITTLITPQEARYFNSEPTVSEIYDLITRANAASGGTPAAAVVGKSSKKYAYGTRMKGFLLTMARFAVMAPEGKGVVIWGAVRILVIRALSSTEHLKKIVDVLEDLGTSYEATSAILHQHPWSSKIQQIVCHHHLTLLDICHDFLKILSEKDDDDPKASKSLWKKKLKTDLERNKKGLESYKVYLDAEVGLISGGFNDVDRRRMGLYRQEGVVYYLDEVSKGWKGVLEASKGDAVLQAKVVDSLCTRISGYDHTASLERYSRAGSSRAMDFITGLPEFLDRTKHGSKKPLLWLYGSAGCGKSAQTAYLIKMLQAVSKENVFYFFCTPEIPESMRVETLLRSILSQLLRTTDHIRHIYYTFEYPLSTEEIAAVIKTIINFRQQWVRNGSNRMYILIDGIDNLPLSEEEELVRMFEKWCWQVQLKVILTNRRGPPLHRPAVFLEGISQVETDVVLYIERELEMGLVKGLFGFEKKVDLVPVIKAAVTDRAGGNFLLATLHLSLIRHAQNEDNLLTLLETLPRDLHQTYNLILNTIKHASQKQQAKKIFNIVGTAARPLSIEELNDYLNWNTVDKEEEGELLPAYSPTDILDVCRGLVVGKQVGGRLEVYFVHESVKEYLLQNGILDNPRAHLEVGRGCLYYLHQRQFEYIPSPSEQELIKKPKPEKKKAHPKEKNILDLQDLSFSSDSDADEETDPFAPIPTSTSSSTPSTDIDTLTALLTSTANLTAITTHLTSKNPFLTYAKEYHLYHTRTMHKSDPGWTHFVNLITEKRKLLVEIIPWVKTNVGGYIEVASRRQYRMLANDWANRMKHFALSRLVVDWATVAEERRSRRGNAPL